MLVRVAFIQLLVWSSEGAYCFGQASDAGKCCQSVSKDKPVDANDVKYLHFQVVCVLVHSLDKCSTSGWRIELTKGRL